MLFFFFFFFSWTSLVAQTVKHLSTMRETQVRALGWEDPLEKEMAIHSSIIAWKIPRTEEPGRLQSMGSQRVGHDWATSLSFFFSSKQFSAIKTFASLLKCVSIVHINVWLIYSLYFRCPFKPPLSVEVVGGSYDFTSGSSGKESTCNAGGRGNQNSITGLGRYLGRGNGNPFQFSCLENPTDRGAWWATVHRVAKSQTGLSDWSHMHMAYYSLH